MAEVDDGMIYTRSTVEAHQSRRTSRRHSHRNTGADDIASKGFVLVARSVATKEDKEMRSCCNGTMMILKAVYSLIHGHVMKIALRIGSDTFSMFVIKQSIPRGRVWEGNLRCRAAIPVM